MFAEKLSPLISSFPQDAEALRRMEAFLGDFEARRGDAARKIRLTPHRMYDIMQAGSAFRLSRLLKILIDARIFRRQVLVRFPSGSGITFSSYADIPKTIRDPDRDIVFDILPDNIEPSYVLVTNESS